MIAAEMPNRYKYISQRRQDTVAHKIKHLFGFRTNLVALMTQNGNNINRSISHEMANIPKNTLAPSSFSEYLKTLAASRNTSLAS